MLSRTSLFRHLKKSLTNRLKFGNLPFVLTSPKNFGSKMKEKGWLKPCSCTAITGWRWSTMLVRGITRACMARPNSCTWSSYRIQMLKVAKNSSKFSTRFSRTDLPWRERRLVNKEGVFPINPRRAWTTWIRCKLNPRLRLRSKVRKKRANYPMSLYQSLCQRLPQCMDPRAMTASKSKMLLLEQKLFS